MAPPNTSPTSSTSPVSRNKDNTGTAAKSLSRANTPSNIDTSLMTNRPTASDTSFKSGSSSAIEHLPRTGTDAHRLPKSKTRYRAETPAKKTKEKTKGKADLAKCNKAKEKLKKDKFDAWPLNRILPDDGIHQAPIENTNPANNNHQKEFTCVVCNRGGFPLSEKNRQQHLDGRAHQQVKGLLEAHQRGEAPSTDLLRIGTKKWKCHACDCAIQRPRDVTLAEALQTHLATHTDRIRSHWLRFKEMARSVAGLRENEIPHDVKKSFI